MGVVLAEMRRERRVDAHVLSFNKDGKMPDIIGMSVSHPRAHEELWNERGGRSGIVDKMLFYTRGLWPHMRVPEGAAGIFPAQTRRNFHVRVTAELLTARHIIRQKYIQRSRCGRHLSRLWAQGTQQRRKKENPVLMKLAVLGGIPHRSQINRTVGC